MFSMAGLVLPGQLVFCSDGPGPWVWRTGVSEATPLRGPRAPRLRSLRARGPGVVLMDLILDAGGAFTWSRGPTTAPVLSIAATRLTLDEPHPVHGRSPHDPETEEVDPSTSGALSDPPDPLGRPAPPGKSTRRPGPPPSSPPPDSATVGRTARLVTLAQQIARDPSSSLPRETRDVGRSQGRLSPAGSARSHLPGPRDAALATHARSRPTGAGS